MSEVQDIQRLSRRIQSAPHSIWKPKGKPAALPETQKQRLQSNSSQPLLSLASPPPGSSSSSRRSLLPMQHMLLHGKGRVRKPSEHTRPLKNAQNNLKIAPDCQEKGISGCVPRAPGKSHAVDSSLAYRTESSLSRGRSTRLHREEQDQHSSTPDRAHSEGRGRGGPEDVDTGHMPSPHNGWSNSIDADVHGQQR